MCIHSDFPENQIMKKILYIEDEPFLGKIVRETLVNHGFDVLWETDGKMAEENFTGFLPDLCVLDIMLPNVDGYTLCRKINSMFPHVPIIFLTAKVETSDLVKGFESGGTDYIRKPFSLEELIVRINNQLRLKTGITGKELKDREYVRIGKYYFYPQRYELHSPAGTIKLSQRDMQVLNLLVSNRNQVTDRKDLLLKVWGDDSFFNSRNLDVYIRKLRQYFREDGSILIQTLKGKGYLFLVPDGINQ
jgi:DNA-binding response OmpR family regulator